jgi:hypothetical protein
MAEQILAAKFRSDERSRHGVSLAVHQDCLYVAWTGTDNNLNVMCSTDGGRSFDSSTKHIIYEQSYARPAIISYKDRLYLAWAGTDGNLNVTYSTDGGRSFDYNNKHTFWEACYLNTNEKTWMLMTIAKYDNSMELRGVDGPSLAVYQDRLYLAWADSTRHLNLVCSTDGGSTLDKATKWYGKDTCLSHEQMLRDNATNTSHITSSSYPGPVLAVYNEQLHIAWTGGDMRLNVMTSTDGGRSFNTSTKQTLKNYANTAPALATLRGQPVLAWSQFAQNRLYVLSASGRELTINDSKKAVDTGVNVQKAPSLVTYHDQLYVAWVDGWSEQWGGFINLAHVSTI